MKKIMFNDKYCLTQAVLSGAKTMTRRVLRDNVPLGNWEETVKHLPYKIGEVVAIAQPYKDIIECMAEYSDIIINADGSINREFKAGWTNKMFVRGNLMPHHIRITDIKLERLQDISEEDCLKEGIIFIESFSIIGEDAYFFAVKRKVGRMYDNILKFFSSPQRAYADLIDKISGKGTWESNPWVVTYEFKLID
ncbi:hypothetical protein [Prevotella jejuni]|uniref:hypothetical protein n=1 Tax=Prevotella jejuni TaxID=1177574 RepID=UPI0028E955A9|nr:hypothetical protein [Prevotella jejuni]